MEKAFRIRWWNLAAAAYILAAALIVILPFKYPTLFENFSGSVIANLWAMLVGALIAWGIHKWFRAERWYAKRSGPHFTFYKNMEELHTVLYKGAMGSPDEARTSLNDENRRKLRQIAKYFHSQAVFFNKFLKFEDLIIFEEIYEATSSLAELDPDVPDIEFMYDYTQHVGKLTITLLEKSKDPNDKKLMSDLGMRHLGWSGKYFDGYEEIKKT